MKSNGQALKQECCLHGVLLSDHCDPPANYFLNQRNSHQVPCPSRFNGEWEEKVSAGEILFLFLLLLLLLLLLSLLLSKHCCPFCSYTVYVELSAVVSMQHNVYVRVPYMQHNSRLGCVLRGTLKYARSECLYLSLNYISVKFQILLRVQLVWFEWLLVIIKRAHEGDSTTALYCN